MTTVKTWIGGAMLAIAFALGATGASAQQYTAEPSALAACKTDSVVWVNLPTGIYHLRGARWYGATKSGTFMCRTAADKAGFRPARNGQ